MADIEHRDITIAQTHILHNWEYANTAAREAATGFVSGDLKKVALQTDNYTYWMLIAVTPTWQPVHGADAFLQDGIAFGETAVIGTTDAEDISIITDGTERVAIDSTGHVGIGDTPWSNDRLTVVQSASGVVGMGLSYVGGLAVDVTKTAGNAVGSVGIEVYNTLQGTTAQGAASGIDVSLTYTGSDTTDALVAFDAFNANTSTGTVTDVMGFKAYSPSNSGGGTITNAYGVYVEDQSGSGITNAYAAYLDGDVFVGGTLSGVHETINLPIYNGGTAVATGTYTPYMVDYACTIVGVRMIGLIGTGAAQSDTYTVNLKRLNIASPGTVDTLNPSAFGPTAASTYEDTTLTSWTTTLAAHDMLEVTVVSAPATATRLAIALEVVRT